MDIIFFDIESTGTNPNIDRIVEFSASKLSYPELKPLRKTTFLVNPTIPIPKEASEVHKITDEMVSNKKPFSHYAPSLFDFFKNCIVAGYNIKRFDIPLLYEEFLRCGIEWDISSLKIIDNFFIYREKEPRNLAAAVKLYTGKEMEEGTAHAAGNDVDYTISVNQGQMQMYAMSLEEMILLTNKGSEDNVDFDGKIKLKDGIAVWNFGKNINLPCKNDIGYCEWVFRSDFSNNTKNVLRKILAQP